MNSHRFHQFRHQIAAFGMAAVFTVSILSSIDLLAGGSSGEAIMAASPAASVAAAGALQPRT